LSFEPVTDRRRKTYQQLIDNLEKNTFLKDVAGHELKSQISSKAFTHIPLTTISRKKP
jgi:hypothetical protein